MMLKSKIQILPNPKQIPNPKFKAITFLDFEIGIYFVVLVLFVVLGFIVNAYAQPVSSVELINNAKEYDGKVVIYAGEIIGDIMVRGENAWINVNDNKNAIGIWTSKDLTKAISNTGSYKSKGDEVEIAGVFHRACPEHGGDLDIHAQTIRKIGSGGITEEPISVRKRNLVFLLLGVLCLALILKQSKSK